MFPLRYLSCSDIIHHLAIQFKFKICGCRFSRKQKKHQWSANILPFAEKQMCHAVKEAHPTSQEQTGKPVGASPAWLDAIGCLALFADTFATFVNSLQGLLASYKLNSKHDITALKKNCLLQAIKRKFFLAIDNISQWCQKISGILFSGKKNQ